MAGFGSNNIKCPSCDKPVNGFTGLIKEGAIYCNEECFKKRPIKASWDTSPHRDIVADIERMTEHAKRNVGFEYVPLRSFDEAAKAMLVGYTPMQPRMNTCCRYCGMPIPQHAGIIRRGYLFCNEECNQGSMARGDAIPVEWNMEKDAARYRWLRDNVTAVLLLVGGFSVGTVPNPDIFDSLVDENMERT